MELGSNSTAKCRQIKPRPIEPLCIAQSHRVLCRVTARSNLAAPRLTMPLDRVWSNQTLPLRFALSGAAASGCTMPNSAALSRDAMFRRTA